MIQFIKVSGEKIFEKASEFQFGKMVPDTKGSGIMINFTAQGLFILMKATYIKDNFIMEKLMAMVLVLILTADHLRVNIKMGKNTGSACTRRPMENYEWGSGLKENAYSG